MTDTADFAALCAAIDGGDDAPLPYLADWLEEAGDRRAVGLRVAVRLGRKPDVCNGGYSLRYWWHRMGSPAANRCQAATLPRLFFDRVHRHPAQCYGVTESAVFRSAAAAFLALAEALADG